MEYRRVSSGQISHGSPQLRTTNEKGNFVSGARDTVHPSSGPAQDLLRLVHLRSDQVPFSAHCATSMLKCFNSSRVGPDLVPYIMMAKIGPYFENEQSHPYLLHFFVLPT